MIPLYTAAQVRAQDHLLIDKLGYPSAQLMEVAGHGIAQWIHQYDSNATVLIYCGSGNNGGDGYVLARWLRLWGHSVSCVSVQPPRTEEAIENANRLNHLNIPSITVEESKSQNPTLVVDAILGTGQRHPLSPLIYEAVAVLHQKKCPILAVDIPTGMDPDSGQTSEACNNRFLATFALGQRKLAHHATSKCGLLVDIDIGLNIGKSHAPSLFVEDANVLECSDIPKIAQSHNDMVKWNRGHVAIMARRGAAVLAARAALSTGVGLVSLLLPKSEWPYLHSLPPEVVLAEPKDLSESRHDALVIGPAWGFQDPEQTLDIWAQFPKPVVADADALRSIAQAQPNRPEHPRVITPHSSEAAALLQKTRRNVEDNPFDSVQSLQRFADVAILKGPYTKISGPRPQVVPIADYRLGVAGSGDILSGVIGGLIAKGNTIMEATVIGTWLHANSAPPYFNGHASDICTHLKAIITQFLEKN